MTDAAIGDSLTGDAAWRGSSFNGLNVAISGQALWSSILPNAPTVIDPLFIKGNTYILFIWAGTNDIVNGRSAAQIYADIQSYCSGRKTAAAAKGATLYIIVSGIAVRVNGGAGSASELVRTAYNDDLRADFDGATAYTRVFTPHAGVTYADVFVDIGADPNIGCTSCYSNLAYFDPDQVHLTVTGYAIPKAYGLNAMRALGLIP